MTSPSSGPVERKVTAATTAAVLTTFVLWILDTYVFVADTVPRPVELLIDLVIVGLVTLGAGYYARHTHRPDLPKV